MSMMEHAVGVVDLDRFAEIDRMEHDEMGSLLLDTMAENAKLRHENELLKLFADGTAVVTDCWKDGDGTMHVLTTDGERIYEYTRGGIAAENVKLRELVRDMWQSCPVYTADCYGCEHHRSDGGCKLYDRMCELGIEV